MAFKWFVFFTLLVMVKVCFSLDQLATLREKALRGNPHDELAYAQALFPSSKDEAFKWAEKAGKQGLAEAWFWIGNNTPNGFPYYKRAAELGYPDAFPVLIDHYMLSGTSADYDKAKAIAELARQKNIQIGFDQNDSQEKINTINHCLEAGLPKIPPSDLPSPQEASRFKDLDCDKYRYGLGTAIDFVKYRQCLLAQKEVNNISLSEIYANGWGVARNPALALALICHADNLAPAELYGMVTRLYETRAFKKLPKPFDFCKYITSGANMGVCAAIDEKQKAAKQSAELATIMKKWPQKDRLAFQDLKKAADTFFDEHSTLELDMSGTARSAIAIGEKSTLNDQFLAFIKQFEKGRLPKVIDFKEADKNLNMLYAKIMAQPFNEEMMTINQAGIKKTQRAWLQYRDAWARFGTLHYPQTQALAWKTWVTENRIKQLKKLLETIQA